MRTAYINQKDISAKVGKSQSWVSRVLAGKIIPKPEMAERLSKAMDGRISPLQFLWPNGVPNGLNEPCHDVSLNEGDQIVTQEQQNEYARQVTDEV